MCIRPIMTYGCQIWFERSAKTNLKKLQIIQNKNLKTIFKVHRRYSTNLLHGNFKQKMLNTIYLEISQRFEDRCRSSKFAIIRNLFN